MRSAAPVLVLVLCSVVASPALAEQEPAARAAADVQAAEGGMTADDAAERAVQVAPRVGSARAAADQAERAASLGRVGFAPRLDLRASYTRLSRVDQPPFDFGGMEFENPFPQILDHYSTRATVTVPVSDYFLTIWPRYQAAQSAADAARFQSAVEREQVATQARESFYGYVRARAFVVVARDSVTLLEAHVDDLEALVGAGQATRADAMQARARLAEAQVQLSSATGSQRVAEAALRRLLDLAPEEPLQIGEDAFAPVERVATDADDLLSKALSRRPEVRAMRALLGTREHAVDAQKGSLWPRLAVVGNLDYTNPNVRTIPQEERFNATWDIGVALSWSPNDFVSGKVEVGQAELDVVRARSDLALLEDQIAVEAARAAADREVAFEAIESAQRGLEAAREAWRSRRDLFGVGEALASDVLEAESALRRAEIAQIDAYISARLAEAHIARVLGRAASSK